MKPAKKIKIKNTKCLSCDNEIIKKRVNQDYCASCKEVNKEAKRLANLKYPNGFGMGICCTCKEPFQKTTYIHYECHTCKNKKTLLKEYGVGICVVCKNEFQKKRDIHKICSEQCREQNITNKRHTDERYSQKNLMRIEIFARDKFQCVYCGKSSIEHRVTLHLDHIYPKVKSGTNDIYNLVTSCQECNLEKGTIVFAEDIIIRLWERNENLHKNKKVSFKAMRKIFNRYYSVKRNEDPAVNSKPNKQLSLL